MTKRTPRAPDPILGVEQALIADLLVYPSGLSHTQTILTGPEPFIDRRHGLIYETLCRLGEAADAPSVAHELKDQIDPAYLSELISSNLEGVSPATLCDRAKRILEDARQRTNGTSSETRPRERPHLTDLGNCERLVELHGHDLRYVQPWASWFVWNGSTWAKDTGGAAVRRAKDTVRNLYVEAGGELFEEDRKDLVKHALRSESERSIQAMLRLACSENGIPIAPDDLDRSPWFLTCENGTIDLRTGNLRESRREDLITRRIPAAYNSRALCPRWEQFLLEIMPDQETVEFLQRAVGYSLTGDTREQCLFILHGTGANGKTVFTETLMTLFGDYGLRTPTETLLAHRGESIPNDIARLKGARLVTASESEEGRRLSEALVKELTGGDTISARFLHAEFFDFRPVCKIWLRTNHRPAIRGTDDAIWRRIRLIPFEQSFPDGDPRRDPGLTEKLRGELPGILAWAVQGALSWQEKGLPPPPRVRAASQAYREQEDVLKAFLLEETEEGEGYSCPGKDLYARYLEWCGKDKPISRTAFGQRLQERGYVSWRDSHARHWRGLTLRGAL